MILVLALGVTTLVVLPVAGLVALAAWIRSCRQGARLDRAGGGR